jgi:hypothetical protein
VFVLFALTVGVAITAGVHFFHGPDRDQYLASNERILTALPLPPGAHETSRQILRDEETVFGEQLSHTVGYTTYVNYAVPDDSLTSKDVVAFYKQRLLGWSGTSWVVVDRTSFACFARKGATVSIQPEGMETPGATSPKSYGIAVDHKGGDCK